MTGLVASVPPLMLAGAAFGAMRNGVKRNEKEIKAVEERIDKRLERMEDSLDYLVRERHDA